MNAVLAVANAALDRATDEVITNFGVDTGRYIRLMADIESREDISAESNRRAAELEIRPVWYTDARHAESHSLDALAELTKFIGRPPDAFGVYGRGRTLRHVVDRPTFEAAERFRWSGV